MKNYKWLLILLCCLSCKEGSSTDLQATDTVQITAKAAVPEGQKDIYINKIFHAGDELQQLEFVRKVETDIDSISCSIYKVTKTGQYIVSIEKLLKNEDVAQYQVIDTLNLRSEQVTVRAVRDKETSVLELLQNGKILKTWRFASAPHRIASAGTAWQGNFEGSFLRLKDESADPRAWGKISLTIEEQVAKVHIESYSEVVVKDMKVIYADANKIRLADKGKEDLVLTIISVNGTYNLSGSLMQDITGIKETYTLKKI